MRNAKFVLAAAALTMLATVAMVSAGDTPAPVRPKILGISSVQIAVSNVDSAREFYSDVTGVDMICHWCEDSPPPTFAALPSGQTIEIVPGDPSAHSSRLTEVTFAVSELEPLRQLLKKNGISFRESKVRGVFPSIQLRDPEGNALRFVPPFLVVRPKVAGKDEKPSTRPDTFAPLRIIHAGWVVKDRAAMDKFYKDILGFHVYWHGGMKDSQTDWVDMQVPDGTDWLEYMLNIDPQADKQELGVMNHFALGVPDVRAAANQLEKAGVKLPEPPQIGRDGKWQLNLYDPDFTRVEIMEFAPVEKPCCSEYTGPHPKP
jgi:catechol 2,3-dioxygenase-like lactoylglutathione lyase family enzyme